MNGKPIKIPGPDHPITITPETAHVIVRAGGQVIADTNRALALKEASYPGVFYIPREDAKMDLLSRTDHQTYCPYKGDAAYFSLPTGDEGRNAVWTYESPYDAVSPIKDHLAFYADKVEIEVRA
ncbi:DUF427 domain-containing protein [Rhizobium sp. LjRoot254]|uniref:DUF427 domain-containing protein n=1 Tax=Rhizobium sp. LjRoot254 TaxID=3342297 RepID=UPI003ECDB9B4